MILFFLGLYLGLTYAFNLGDLWEEEYLKWIFSPIVVPWRFIDFFLHPPIA